MAGVTVRTRGVAVDRGAELIPGQLPSTVISGSTAGGATLPLQAVPGILTALNVKDFGAKGDGVTNDTTAIQAAINALPANGGVVYLPAGTYVTSATLLFSEQTNGCLVGAGRFATTIIPTTALASLPVIRFQNCRHGLVQGMNVQGPASGTAALAAIQAYRTSGHVAAWGTTQMRVIDCYLGADNNANLTYGMDWAASSTAFDINNENGLIYNCQINNAATACVHIGHANSLDHRIVDSVLSNTPTGVLCEGGAFDMTGCVLGSLTSYAFIFKPAVGSGSPSYYHASTASFSGENCTYLAQSLNTVQAGLAFRVRDSTMTGGTATTTPIDWQAPSSQFAMTGSDWTPGQAGVTASFTDAGSHAAFIGNSRLGFTTYSYNGLLRLIGNHHMPGTVTLTNLGSGSRELIGESGGSLANIMDLSPTTGAGTVFSVDNTSFDVTSQGAFRTKAAMQPGDGSTARCALWSCTGVPAVGLGANGDLCFRQDGGAGTTLYQKRAGAWVATAA